MIITSQVKCVKLAAEVIKLINQELAQDVFKDAGENVSFVTLELNRLDQAKEKAVIQAFADRYPAILRSMRIRCIHDHLKVAIGFSYKAWTYLFPDAPIPKELETFAGIKENGYEMPATAGDIFIHIRADRATVIYETQRQFTEILRSVTHVVDETKGFRFFEGRAIIGFVDGTEVPTGYEAIQDSLIDSEEDPYFINGSYAFAQKWYHDMRQWNDIATAMQEKAIGRKKFSDTELEDEDKMPNAHTLASHLEEDGVEKKIIRMNVPYSNPAQEDTGTFFIAYSNHWNIIKGMLQQMMDEKDFLLSFSKVLSGQAYFVPSFAILEDIADGKL